MIYADTDRSLHELVLDALGSDSRIAAGKVGVAVDRGVVTLIGTLSSFTEKWAAEDAVKAIRGVRGIANELRVDLPGMHVRDDADVAKAVVTVLRWSASVPQTLQVEVHDGLVTLSGEVEWPYQRRDAIAIVRRIAGVRGVYDSMTVAEHQVDPEELHRRISSRFARLAAFDARNVKVDVAPGGVVRLSGVVASLSEADEAESAAYTVAGTTEVRNEIRIAEEEW